MVSTKDFSYLLSHRFAMTEDKLKNDKQINNHVAHLFPEWLRKKKKYNLLQQDIEIDKRLLNSDGVSNNDQFITFHY